MESACKMSTLQKSFLLWCIKPENTLCNISDFGNHFPRSRHWSYCWNIRDGTPLWWDLHCVDRGFCAWDFVPCEGGLSGVNSGQPQSTPSFIMLPWKPPLQKLNPKLYPLTAEIITPGSHIPNNKIRMICQWCWKGQRSMRTKNMRTWLTGSC